MSAIPLRHAETAPSVGGFATYPSLRGKVALVTGGASGIGGEVVRQLASQGATVACLDLAETADEHPSVRFLRCDMRDIAQVQAAVQSVGEEFGRIDILVNNAARDDRIPFDQLDVERWDEQINVNVRHHFFTTQAVAPWMRAAGGSVVNMGSISAHIDLRDLAGYVTAKAGIEGLTRILARELGPDRIRVNCVIPGWIMTERQLRDWVTPEAEALIASSQALAEKLGPEDVARLVLWLAADDSRLCTGQRWIVDGGWM